MLFATVKPDIKGKLIFPPSIVNTIRKRWPDEEVGRYDTQHEARGRRVSMSELLHYEWGECHCQLE